MKKMQAYIALRGSNNITELSDVPVAKMQLVAKKMRPVQDQRVKKTKWVVLRWPTPSMAQLAGMSTEAFEDFYFEVCTLDYEKLQPGMKALKGLMRSNQRTRNEFAIQYQGNSGGHLRGRSEHSGRRSFHGAGEELRGGPHHIQCADNLSKYRLRRDPP
jgi:leucyl aminopeptidase (aminopeptidase T)